MQGEGIDLGNELLGAGALDEQGAEIATPDDFAPALDLGDGAGFELDETPGLGAVAAPLADFSHEPAGHVSGRTLPAVELYAELEQCLAAVFDAMLPHRDVGGRLISCFEEAGLPTPQLIWESIAGGYDSLAIPL